MLCRFKYVLIKQPPFTKTIKICALGNFGASVCFKLTLRPQWETILNTPAFLSCTLRYCYLHFLPMTRNAQMSMSVLVLRASIYPKSCFSLNSLFYLPNVTNCSNKFYFHTILCMEGCIQVSLVNLCIWTVQALHSQLLSALIVLVYILHSFKVRTAYFKALHFCKGIFPCCGLHSIPC